MKTLLDVQQQLAAGKFEFSRHAFRRVVERNISEQEIREAGVKVDLIENYPEDKYSPSALPLGFHGGWTRVALSGIVCRVGFDEDHHNL